MFVFKKTFKPQMNCSLEIELKRLNLTRILIVKQMLCWLHVTIEFIYNQCCKSICVDNVLAYKLL